MTAGKKAWATRRKNAKTATRKAAAKKAWNTIRKNHTVDEIHDIYSAAAKKAWKTMRENGTR